MGFAERSMFACAVLAIGATACTREPVQDAPEAMIDSLDTRDEGTSYNGWTQFVTASIDACGFDQPAHSQILFRDYGDATRGGGACAVDYDGSSCSSDSDCIPIAQSGYGSQAWGYCYGGACYTRAGSQAAWCSINPNRSPSNPVNVVGVYAGYVLGCMTKTAGPNTACGGSDSSQYMRAITARHSYVSVPPYCE